jgi:hypothetical protein
MKIKRALIAFGVVFVIVVLGAYAYIRTTPRYSLYQLKSALENHDPERALLFIDIDSIVDNLLRDALLKQDPAPKNEWEKMGQNFGKSLALMMAPAMKETLKSRFKSAIASVDEKNDLQKIKSAGLWDGEITVSGGSATVTFKDDATIKFRMIKSQNGYWKITEIIPAQR